MFKKAIIIGVFFGLSAILLAPMVGQAIVIKNYSWNQVTSDGFGDWNNSSVSKMLVFKGRLYVSTTNGTSGTEIWRTGNGTTWEQVNADGFGNDDNESVTAMTVYRNKLYVGTLNQKTGTEIWYTKGGKTWKQKNEDGFGADENIAIGVLQPFKGKLYAFTVRDDNSQTFVYRAKYPKKATWKQAGEAGLIPGSMALATPGTSARMNHEMYVGGESNSFVYKTGNGKDWEVANNGTDENSEGWGETGNTAVSAMVVKNGRLFVGTENETYGSQLWKYDQGVWVQRGGAGLGDPENIRITKLVTKKGAKSGRQYLYASLYNENGLKIFRSRGGSKWYQLNEEDGFGNYNNTLPSDMEFFSQMLFVSTNKAVWATDFSTN